jgi:hypothetical protein
MKFQRLEDGSAVSTPMFAGFCSGFTVPAPCLDEAHQWEEALSKEEIPKENRADGFTHVRMERCTKCGYVRARLTKE